MYKWKFGSIKNVIVDAHLAVMLMYSGEFESRARAQHERASRRRRRRAACARALAAVGPTGRNRAALSPALPQCWL